jgi:hypothetical protein
MPRTRSSSLPAPPSLSHRDSSIVNSRASSRSASGVTARLSTGGSVSAIVVSATPVHVAEEVKEENIVMREADASDEVEQPASAPVACASA